MGRKEKRFRATQNKRFEKLEGSDKKFENIAYFLVYSFMAVGMIGLIITTFIDPIRTQPVIYGWLQKTGMVGFLLIFCVAGEVWRRLEK